MDTPAHDELLEDISATREQLGATVEELAHRLDVKAQVDEKVAETKDAVHAKVAETKETVHAKVAAIKSAVDTDAKQRAVAAVKRRDVQALVGGAAAAAVAALVLLRS